MMNKHLNVLGRVRVASPCTAPWKDMAGDDRVRHCNACDQKVFNLSEMTAADAAALVTRATGRLCVRYYQRADGTMLTQDCPVGLQRVRRATVRTLAAAVAAFVFVGTTLAALARGERGTADLRLRYFEPFGRAVAWFDQLGVMPPTAPTSVFLGFRRFTLTHEYELSNPEAAHEMRERDQELNRFRQSFDDTEVDEQLEAPPI